MNTASKNKKYRFLKVVLIIIGVLIILRLILPHVILSYANKSLDELEGYTGHIEDIDLFLYRGSYAINGININKIDSATNQAVPFFSTDVIDISVEWNSLFKGKIVGELEFANPEIHFMKEKIDPEDVQKDTTDFRQILKSIMPLQIDRFEVNNGRFHYIDSTTKPAVNFVLENIYILARDLKTFDNTSALPASVVANADIYGGTMDLNLKLNPMEEYPTFEMTLEAENTNLTELNDFFEAYANIDVQKGTFGLYAEVAGKDKKFAGYVKPVITDLQITGPQDEEDSFLKKIWEGIVGVATSILESNNEEEQIASKIPISGDYDDPSIMTWYAVGSLIRNAFIQAIYPSITNEISLASIKKMNKKDDETFLEKIFDGMGGKDPGENEDKEKKKNKEKEKEKEKEKKMKEKEKEKEKEKKN
jgi:hypothetical protein